MPPSSGRKPPARRGSISPRSRFTRHPPEEAIKRLNTGKTPLVIEPTAPAVDLSLRPDTTRGGAARQVIDDILQEAAHRKNPRPTHDVYVSEPGSRYIDFLIPGLIGLNAMGGGLWGIGFLAGQLPDRQAAQAVRRHAHAPSRFPAGAPRRALHLRHPRPRRPLAARERSCSRCRSAATWLLVIAIDILGALAFAGIGLLVACRASTTETVSGLMNLVMLPMWLFSGVFFSSDRFPAGRPALDPGPAAHPAGQRPAPGDSRGGRPVRCQLVALDPRLLGSRHLRPGPAVLPLDLMIGRTADA